MDYLAKIKTLRRIISTDYDAEIEIYIDMVRQQILNYCNLYEFPSELDYVLIRMVIFAIDEANAIMSLIKAEKNTDSTEIEIPTGPFVKKITEDSASVEFDTSATSTKVNSMSSLVSRVAEAVNAMISTTTELSKYKSVYK